MDTIRLWEDQRPEGSLIPKTMQQEIQQECLEFIKFNVCHLLLNATYKLNVIVVLSKAQPYFHLSTASLNSTTLFVCKNGGLLMTDGPIFDGWMDG